MPTRSPKRRRSRHSACGQAITVLPDPLHDDWTGWDWTEEAQSLHGITRRLLDREGLSPAFVLAALIAAVGSARILADSYLGPEWLATLADAAGTAAPIAIGHIEEVIDRLGADDADIARAQALANARSFTRHRAGGDAQWLAVFLNELEEVVTTRECVRERPLFDWAPRPIRSPIGIAA